MSNTKTNEKYRHACDCLLEKLENSVFGLSNVGYNDNEIKRIIEFYLLNAPIAKSEKQKKFGCKDLKEYGWFGNSGMSKLERLLLRKAELQMFCFIKSDKSEFKYQKNNSVEEIKSIVKELRIAMHSEVVGK